MIFIFCLITYSLQPIYLSSYKQMKIRFLYFIQGEVGGGQNTRFSLFLSVAGSILKTP